MLSWTMGHHLDPGLFLSLFIRVFAPSNLNTELFFRVHRHRDVSELHFPGLLPAVRTPRDLCAEDVWTPNALLGTHICDLRRP